MYGVALLTSTLLTIAGARFYERCELARDLLKLGIRKDQIATWVCIAYHESRFDTAARNPSSGDHGILQISEIYWCGAGKACGLPCSALRDDDISDDVQCALTIYEEHTRLQGNGFLAWVVYPNYCKQNPKKYLADCNFSAKDGSYSTEDRARSTNVYNSYPKVNATLSNAVQSVSYPQSDPPLPGYLSIVALLRGKFESDFERDYNNKLNVNSLPPKTTSVSYDFRSSLTTRKPITSTTTNQPEPYYKPVKPWRIIETNQFRRRMMNIDKIPTETMNDLTKFINKFSRTTPTPTANTLMTNNKINTLPSSSLSDHKAFEKAVAIFSKTCCKSDVPSSLPTKLVSSSSAKIFDSFLSLKTHSNAPNSNLTQEETKDKIEKPERLTTIGLNAYNNSWISHEPNLQWVPVAPKSTQASIMKSNTLATTRKLSLYDYSPTRPPSILTTTNRPFTNTVIEDTPSSQSKTTESPRKEKILPKITMSSKDVTTAKPTIPTRGSTKWSVQQSDYQQSHGQNKTDRNPFKTEKPLTSWRSAKSWPYGFQAGPVIATKNSTTPSPQPYNIGKHSGGVTPLIIKNSIPTSTPSVGPTVKQGTTETPLGLILTSPKTTLSIFDLYLNPTKRPQIPNYRFLFSDNSASNFKIFAGGTTSSPIINSAFKNADTKSTREERNEFKEQ